MKPNFALILSMEGIALLQRSSPGWALVGEASPESPDLPADMAKLRDAAERLAPGEATFKVVIPNDQIRYISVPAGSADPATRQRTVEQALDGQTPYPLDELAIDHTVSGKMLHIAAVALETLQEADEFARGFGFTPVCFAAMPETRDYAGEPYFGTAHDLPEDIHVEPDAVAIRVSGRVKVPEEAAPDAAADADAAPVAFVSRRSRDGEDAEAAAETPTPVAAPAPAPKGDTSKPKVELPLSPPQTDFDAPEGEDTAKRPNPLAGIGARLGSGVAGFRNRIGAQMTARQEARAAKKADALAAKDAKAEAAEKSIPQVANVALSEGSEPPAPVAPLPSADIVDAEKPDAGKATAKPSRKKAKAAKDTAPPVLVAEAAPTDISDDPRTLDAQDKRAIGALSAEERRKEAERLTVFGARRGDSYETSSGSPAMALGIVLAVFLLGTAGWAAIFMTDGMAPLMGDSSDATTETAEDRAVARAIEEAASETQSEQAEEVTPPPALDVTKDAGTEPVSPLIVTEAVEAQTESTTETPTDRAVEDTTEAAPDTATAAPTTGPEAEAQYAATGIWQQSPDPLDPDTLGSDSATSGDSAGAEGPPRQRQQSVVAMPAPDALPQPPGPPSVPGKRYVMDDRGLVIATPEGAETPSGTIVYLGSPPLDPPTRPGTQEDAALRPTPQSEFTPEVAPEAPAATDIAEVDTADTDIAATDIPQTDSTPPQSEEVASAAPAARPVKRPLPRPFAVPAPQTAAIDTIVQEVVSTAAATTNPAAAASLARDAIASGGALNDDTRASASAGLALAPDENADAEPELEPQFVALRPLNRPANIEDLAARVTAAPPPAVVPSIPSSASVARQATLRNAINLRQINLIGVYGQPSDRRALIRLANGRYRKVKVGDRIDGGRVLAIGDASLRYQKNGRNLTLDMPSG